MKLPSQPIELSTAGRQLDGAIWFDEQGLRLPGLHPSSHAELREWPGRLELLLALAFRRRLTPPILASVVKAAEESHRGDHAIANLRLALANLSRAAAADDLPMRVALADTLLAKGMTAGDLLEALEQPPDGALTKYDAEQPRVPAGSGRESGRWTRDREAAESPSRAAFPLAVAGTASRGAFLFTPQLSASFLSSLGALATTLGAAAVVGGILFVPWQNDVSSSGSLPGDTAHRYTFNSDEGLLQIRDKSGDVLAAGHADRLGIFHDVNTGIAFAREVEGALVFDGSQMTAAVHSSDDAAAASHADAETDDDEPKLCPDPGPDQPGSEGASDRAKAYQEQISRMINPHRPLEFGQAMNLINPFTGKLVHFDECAEQSGTMIEAKGPGFDGVLSFPAGRKNVTDRWLNQSLNEIRAAGTRQLEWYFAEQKAANYARQLFADQDMGRERIVIKVQPAGRL